MSSRKNRLLQKHVLPYSQLWKEKLQGRREGKRRSGRPSSQQRGTGDFRKLLRLNRLLHCWGLPVCVSFRKMLCKCNSSFFTHLFVYCFFLVYYQVYQARLHDLLWLELLTWRYGLSMKALDEALIQSRDCFVPDLLSDILDFEYVPSKTLSQGNWCSKTSCYFWFSRISSFLI